MKKFLLLLVLLLCTSNAWATNKYARTVGGNWTTDATWSTTSGGAADTTAPTASDDVFLDANSGNVTISATSVGKSLTCTGYTGTLTHNAFNLTISGDIVLVSGMTYTPQATSTITQSGTGSITTGGKLLPLFVHATGSSVLTLQDNMSFMASKVITLTINSGTSINLNGFTISGNSSTNRVLIRSGVLGTAANITNTTGTFANADFRDITFSTNADYSAITGKSGDCGGNSNATFTTSQTNYWVGGTGNWSDVNEWASSSGGAGGSGRVPLPQDHARFDASSFSAGSQTVTADMPRLGTNIDWTGATNSPTWSVTTTPTIYGNIKFISSMTHTNSVVTTFEGRGTHTIESAGKSFGANVVIASVGGSYTLSDAFTMTAGTLTLTNGTFDSNELSVTVAGAVSITGSTTRAFDISNSTLTISSSTGSTTLFNAATLTGLTATYTGSTIYLRDIGSSGSKTFSGGGGTYNDLKLLCPGGTGAYIISGSNTFNRIYTDGGGTKSITLPGSTTTTILNGSGLNNGTNVITFTASSGSATISKSSGTLEWDYVNLTNIPSTGGATFYAGSHSTNGGGNTGWIFSDAPNNSLLMFAYPFSSRRFNSNR